MARSSISAAAPGSPSSPPSLAPCAAGARVSAAAQRRVDPIRLFAAAASRRTGSVRGLYASSSSDVASPPRPPRSEPPSSEADSDSDSEAPSAEGDFSAKMLRPRPRPRPRPPPAPAAVRAMARGASALLAFQAVQFHVITTYSAAPLPPAPAARRFCCCHGCFVACVLRRCGVLRAVPAPRAGLRSSGSLGHSRGCRRRAAAGAPAAHRGRPSAPARARSARVAAAASLSARPCHAGAFSLAAPRPQPAPRAATQRLRAAAQPARHTPTRASAGSLAALTRSSVGAGGRSARWCDGRRR